MWRWILPFSKPIVEAMRLKSGPDVFPKSTLLLMIYFTGLLVVNALQVVTLNFSSDVSKFAVMIEPFVVVALVSALMFVMRMRQRNVQTLCAVLGVTVAFSLISLLLNLIWVYVPESKGVLDLITWLIIVWWFSVIAFIFSRALDISMFTSFGLSLAYTVLIFGYQIFIVNTFGVPLATS